MSLKDFELIRELGKGAFGSVCLVKRIADGNVYAIKRVKISQLNKKEQENALNEVRILASISHPNIIGYKEAFFEDESKTLNIVMEYADDGDLESKIQKHLKNKTNFSENELWSYLIQMIQGLKSLHDNKIMHRDLKSANVFLMKNGLVKLGDLNVSKVVKMGLVYTQTGTPYYASPEVWADKPYDYKSDIWSVGCVIYELCALKPPFRGKNLEQLYQCVKKGIYEPISKIYSSEFAKTLYMLLNVNPNNRPDCDGLLSNPLLIKRIDFNKNFDFGSQGQLLKTIKLPRNMNEINQKLPKTKKYEESTGLTLKKSSSDINKSSDIKKPSNYYIRDSQISDKNIKNIMNRLEKKLEINNINDSYEINYTAENIDRSKICQLEDKIINEEKELIKLKNKKLKNDLNKIPPTYEEYKNLISLNNSSNNNKILENINNSFNKADSNQIKDYSSKIKIEPIIIKKNINDKCDKNNQNLVRSRTPNQPSNRKENSINKNERNSKENNLIQNNSKKQNLNNLNEKSDECYQKNYINIFQKPPSKLIEENNSNKNYIKLNYHNEKNIYDNNLYSKEKPKNINNNIEIQKEKDKEVVRAFSARPNRITSNNPVLISSNSNNHLIIKNFNSNPNDVKNFEKDLDYALNKNLNANKKNYLSNNYNNNQNILKSKNSYEIKNNYSNNQNNIISSRPGSTRDKILNNINNYNLLSKNNNHNNYNYLLNPQKINNINNYPPSNNVVKKDIHNLENKFNIISPMKIAENSKRIGSANINNNDICLKNNDRTNILDKNMYLNLKLNNEYKAIIINNYRK